MHTSLHYHQRITLTRVTLRRRQALTVFSAIFKFQRIQRLHFSTNFETPLRIQKPIQPSARGNTVMMIAFGANTFVFLQIRVIQHPLA